MTTYDEIRAALDAAESAGLPVPSVDFDWHDMSDDQATTIARAFPGWDWEAHAGGHSEWIGASRGGLDLTVFIAKANPDEPIRAKAVLAAAVRPALTAAAELVEQVKAEAEAERLARLEAGLSRWGR